MCWVSYFTVEQCRRVPGTPSPWATEMCNPEGLGNFGATWLHSSCFERLKGAWQMNCRESSNKTSKERRDFWGEEKLKDWGTSGLGSTAVDLPKMWSSRRWGLFFQPTRWKMKQDKPDTCQFSINPLMKSSCLHGSFSSGIPQGTVMVEGMDKLRKNSQLTIPCKQWEKNLSFKGK